MPLKVKKMNDKYCLVEPDGSVMKGSCHSDRSQTVAQLRAIESDKKLEELVTIQLESGGPVVLGIAATNRPHLPLPPMSIVEVEGKEMVRVPFLRKGVFRNSKYGDLVFDQKTMDRMLENHNAGLSHYGVSLDIRHKPELGALAWFDSNHGGFIRQEQDEKFGNLLVAYGEPTTQEAKEIVNRKVYNYASVEFHPKWKSPVKKLSMDDFEEIEKEDLVSLDEDSSVETNDVVETILLFNPFHDALGRFTSKGAGGGSSRGSAKKGAQKIASGAAKGAKDAGRSLKKFSKSKTGQSLKRIGTKALVRGAISGSAAMILDGLFGVKTDVKKSIVWGAVLGAASGTLEELTALEFSGLETISLAEEDSQKYVRGFLKVLREFLKSEESLFGIPEKLGDARLGRIGFKKQDGHYTIGREKASKLVEKLEASLKKKLEVSMEVREDGTGVLTAEEVEQVKAMQQKLQEASDKIVQLEEQVNDLNVQLEEVDVEYEDTDEDQIPESTRIQLEEHQKEIKRLKREALRTQVDLVIAKAENYRDDDGRGHSPVLLEAVKNAMLGKPVGETESVKLEENTISGVADYFRKALVYILEQTPGTVQFENRTEADEQVSLESGDLSGTDFAGFWGTEDEEGS